MKHFWVGAGILGILLGLSLWSAAVLEKIHTPLQQDLEAAAESVMAADWETAQALASRAEVRWQKERNKIAALASHNTMDEIDCLFRQLWVYAWGRDTLGYAAACRELACLCASISDAHECNWWNLL